MVKNYMVILTVFLCLLFQTAHCGGNKNPKKVEPFTKLWTNKMKDYGATGTEQKFQKFEKNFLERAKPFEFDEERFGKFLDWSKVFFEFESTEEKNPKKRH